MLRILKNTRGDTLVEVLFAVTVFSLVAVGALAIMNQGTAISQRSLESTLVRQEIDSQAETLRFLHDSYVAAYRPGETSEITGNPETPFEQWQVMLQSIIQTDAGSASDFAASTSTCPEPPTGSFIIDSRNAAFVPLSQDILTTADNYAKLEYDENTLSESKGLWIEAVRSNINESDPYQSNIGFIDFHIRACWFGPGSDTPMTIGTIVRLYEPR